MHTLILGDQKQTSQKNYRTHHMQKVSCFWAQMKKRQLGRFCPEPFNNNITIHQIIITTKTYWVIQWIVISYLWTTVTRYRTKECNSFYLQQLYLRALDSRFENNCKYKIFSYNSNVCAQTSVLFAKKHDTVCLNTFLTN